MVREIVKDVEALSKKCGVALKKDVSILNDMVETAKYINANKEQYGGKNCCGLAANQIGFNKRLIIVGFDDGTWMQMMNPMIVKRSPMRHLSTEGCMSLDGEKTVERYDWVHVKFQGRNGRIQTLEFRDFMSNCVQHEIDHLNGVLI